MPLKIKAVTAGSLAHQNNIKSGDKILSINDHTISDFIDLQFHSADEELDLVLVNPDGEKRKITIFQDWSVPLGIEPESHNCISCINKCVFCFVDQIQPGFRKSLYIKDDDYRLSFAYGNFITLTNLTGKNLEKIYDQRLSPLYVSVHTTNSDLHQKMLKYLVNFNIYDRLKELTLNNIQLHTQIVVIPEWNDGIELKRTLQELDALGDNILSIGIVPIGLTKTRKFLTPLRGVTPSEAEDILMLSSNFKRTYCADELYISAEKKIPEEIYYDDYPQLENGIGMLRMLMENWKLNSSEFIRSIKMMNEKIVFITGSSAYDIINEIAVEINSYLPEKVRTIEVVNNMFGTTVTVAGLLTAADIKEQVSLKRNEIAVVCSNLFNDDKVTLDNVHQLELKEFFNNKLIEVDEEFTDWKMI